MTTPSATQPALTLFGVPALAAGGGRVAFTGERPFQLLAYLACRRRWVQREELADILYPEREAAQARSNLRKVLLLADRIAGGTIERQGELLRWSPSCDLARFEVALDESRFEEAIDLGAATLMENLGTGLTGAGAAWLLGERQRADTKWQAACMQQLTLLASRPAAAARLALRMLERDPLDEEAILVLAKAHIAHGDAGAARAAIAAYARRLDAELGVEPSAALRELAESTSSASARAGAAPAPAPRAGADDPSFIGRRAELNQLVELMSLPEGRFVTVTGPGGVGKTALLRAALPLLAPAFPGAVLSVSLTDLVENGQVPARIVQALGSSLDAVSSPWSQVGAAIGHRLLLLALDNAEHLPSLAADLATLLASCPGLRLLVTSRERMHPATASLVLEGLPLPDDDETNLDALRRFDVVRLFEARARAASPRFVLAGSAAAMLRVLRACDGMPLAVELAAAATRLLPLAELATELTRSLDILEAAAGEDSRGLRASIARSWRALDDARRAALAALAWLPGSFARAMAEQVAGVRINVVAALLDASLLQSARAGRFALHPLLRQYVAEQPGGVVDFSALELRHAAWIDERLAAFDAPHLMNSSQAAAIDDELPHIRAAWSRAVTLGSPAALARFARVMGAYYVHRGGGREILPFLAHAVAAMDSRGRAGLAARARTLRTQAMLEYQGGDLEAAVAHARQALRWASRAGDADTGLGCLTVLGNALIFAGDQQAASVYFEQALRRAREQHNLAIAASAANGLGLVERAAGRFDAALTRFHEAGDLWARTGNFGGQLGALVNAANIETVRRQWPVAQRTLEAALALADANRIESKRAILCTMLAEVALERGDAALARRRVDEAFAAEPASTDMVVPIELRLTQSRLAAGAGQAAAARDALAQAVEQARRSGSTTMQLSCVVVAARLLADAGARVAAERLWNEVGAHPRVPHSLRLLAEHGLQSLGAEAARTPLPLPATPLDRILDDAVSLVQHAPPFAAGCLASG